MPSVLLSDNICSFISPSHPMNAIKHINVYYIFYYSFYHIVLVFTELMDSTHSKIYEYISSKVNSSIIITSFFTIITSVISSTTVLISSTTACQTTKGREELTGKGT